MVSVNKKDSIYFQLLKLLTFSAIIAVTFFVLMNRNSDDFIARYYEESDYAEKEMKDMWISFRLLLMQMRSVARILQN